MSQVHLNLSREQLAQTAIARKEGTLADNGALQILTGKRTGRSPKDRFIVCDNNTNDEIDWGAINQPINPDVADQLWQRVEAHLAELPEYFETHLHVGSDANHYLPLRVRTETAWQNLFAQMIFIRPDDYNPKNREVWEVLNCAGFTCDPQRDGVNSDGAVILDFSRRRILLAGMRYAGEMKKALFTTLNYLLPERDVLPMHCGANYTKDKKCFLFFGLSGTGKTTLATDPATQLIGDDEHGWSKEGSVFNFEGGCYAKCINLTQRNEPVIYNAIRDYAIMENVVLRSDGSPDYADNNLTENTRCCYPLEHVPGRVLENRAQDPSALIFLTCDLYGVMPPVSRLSVRGAAYHFLSGYTAAVAGVEVGAAISPTFSTCFGAPFFPRPARVYVDLLIQHLRRTETPVFLVNTGWTGGGHGVGNRFPIPVTRAIVHAIQSGALNDAPTTHLTPLNLDIPKAVNGVDANYLNPRDTWKDKKAFDRQVAELVGIFKKNFGKYQVSQEVIEAGPS